jgi:hypothetical protein
VIEAEAKSSRWKDIAYAANWLIWLVFAAELALILVVAPRRAAALRAHWLDAMIVTPERALVRTLGTGSV